MSESLSATLCILGTSFRSTTTAFWQGRSENSTGSPGNSHRNTELNAIQDNASREVRSFMRLLSVGQAFRETAVSLSAFTRIDKACVGD